MQLLPTNHGNSEATVPTQTQYVLPTGILECTCLGFYYPKGIKKGVYVSSSIKS